MARGKKTTLSQKPFAVDLCSPFLLPQRPHRLEAIKAGPHPNPPRHQRGGRSYIRKKSNLVDLLFFYEHQVCKYDSFTGEIEF
jgi:hypothetical protein